MYTTYNIYTIHIYKYIYIYIYIYIGIGKKKKIFCSSFFYFT